MSDHIACKMKFSLQDVSEEVEGMLEEAVRRRSMLDGASCYTEYEIMLVTAKHARWGIVADAADVARNHGVDWVMIADYSLALEGQISGKEYKVEYPSTEALFDAWRNFIFPPHG